MLYPARKGLRLTVAHFLQTVGSPVAVSRILTHLESIGHRPKVTQRMLLLYRHAWALEKDFPYDMIAWRATTK